MTRRVTELARHAFLAAHTNTTGLFLANLLGPFGNKGIEVPYPPELPSHAAEDAIPIVIVDEDQPLSLNSAAPVSFRLITTLNHDRILRPYLAYQTFACSPYWLGLATLQALQQFFSLVSTSGASASGTTVLLSDADNPAIRAIQRRRLVASYAFAAQLLDERTNGWLTQYVADSAAHPPIGHADAFYPLMAATALLAPHEIFRAEPRSTEESAFRLELMERVLRLRLLGEDRFADWIDKTP